MYVQWSAKENPVNVTIVIWILFYVQQNGNVSFGAKREQLLL